MTKFDPEKFLDTPIYAFDFEFMIGDVQDFLESSEHNIDLQYRRELHAISQKNLDGFPPDYRNHLEENASHRFKVSLPLRVRYGALLAFTTSVEWSIKILNESAKHPIPEKKGDNKNHTIKIIREFSALTGLSADPTIDDYRSLVHIRNCIAHNAGIVDTYKHKDTLPDDVKRLNGFSIGNWHFFGDHICIERDALNEYIDKMTKLVVDLHQLMHERGLV